MKRFALLAAAAFAAPLSAQTPAITQPATPSPPPQPVKVDPFVVMVLSIGFIISVVALHSEFLTLPFRARFLAFLSRNEKREYRFEDKSANKRETTVLAKVTKRFSS